MLDREYVAEVSMMNFENESVESLGAWAIAGGCCRVCPWHSPLTVMVIKTSSNYRH